MATSSPLGAAKKFVYLHQLRPDGSLAHVVCRVDKLVEGYDALVALQPPLLIASLLGRGRAQALALLAKCRLSAFGCVQFGPDPYGGLPLDDEALRTIAPALEGVKRLKLMFDTFSAESFAQIAPRLRQLEVLSLIPPAAGGDAWANAMADVLCTSPHFKRLRVLAIYRTGKPDAARQKRLAKLPSMKQTFFRELTKTQVAWLPTA